MGELVQHHVTLFVTGDAGEHLEDLRRRWDPVAAEQIAAHVTLVYPEEAHDLALLRARLAVAAERIPPFPLRLGPVVAHDSKPSRGVYHLVADPVGVFAWLREFVLASPFTALDLVPHASITHPRTSKRGRKAWKALDGVDPDLEFRIGELCVTALNGDRWVVDQRYVLGGVEVTEP